MNYLKIIIVCICCLSLVSCSFGYAPLSSWVAVDFKTELAKANLGDSSAQYNVAKTYFTACYPETDSITPWGLGCDKKNCEKWYLKSAHNGNTEAQFAIGQQLLDVGQHSSDNCFSKKDNIAAIKWLSIASEHGNERATNALAYLYSDSDFEFFNESKSAKYYQLLADKGDSVAQRKLGRMYANGQGVKRNIELAKKWGLEAALKGDTEAQYDLAKIYFTEVPPNYEEAYYWARLSQLHFSNPSRPLIKFEQHVTIQQKEAVKKRISELVGRQLTEECDLSDLNSKTAECINWKRSKGVGTPH